ncbi:MAG: M48 family metallopeptidase [Chloroflexota bacterium]
MHIVTILFLVMLGLSTAVLMWLATRQMRHVGAHRHAVPADFAQVITLEQHQKGADYTIAKTALERWQTLWNAVVVVGWTIGGGLQWVVTQSAMSGLTAFWQSVLVVVVWFVVSDVLSSPFEWYRTFVIDERFGFNKNTPALFVRDWVLSLVLNMLLGVPLVAGILWFMMSAGDMWWLWAWGVFMVVQIGILWAEPVIIQPLFNKFTPIADDVLRDRIQGLLQRTGFAGSQIFVMDASKRSGLGNAYFTSFGRTKRVVFYDTLLAQLTPGQAEAVLAHEIGHYKHRDIIKFIGFFMLVSLVGFGLLAWLLPQAWFYQAFGVAEPHMGAALVLLMLVAPVFSFVFQPVMSWFTRTIEYAADAYAVKHTNNDDMVGALVALYRDNAGTLTPDPLYVTYHYSHPPASARIGHIRSL